MMPANRTGAPERERPGPTRETGPLGKSAGTTHADSANDTPAGDAAQDCAATSTPSTST